MIYIRLVNILFRQMTALFLVLNYGSKSEQTKQLMDNRQVLTRRTLMSCTSYGSPCETLISISLSNLQRHQTAVDERIQTKQNNAKLRTQ